jgi:hypothetical protein
MGQALACDHLKSLNNKQQQDRDEQREDAQSFGHGEAEDQIAELALCCGRITHCAFQEAAENVANADCGAQHAQASKACTNVFCGFCVHDKFS